MLWRAPLAEHSSIYPRAARPRPPISLISLWLTSLYFSQLGGRRGEHHHLLLLLLLLVNNNNVQQGEVQGVLGPQLSATPCSYCTLQSTPSYRNAATRLHCCSLLEMINSCSDFTEYLLFASTRREFMKHFIFPLFSLFSATGTVSFSLCYVVPGSSCYSIDRKNPPNKIAKSPLKNTNSAVENWLSSELEKFLSNPSQAAPGHDTLGWWHFLRFFMLKNISCPKIFRLKS